MPVTDQKKGKEGLRVAGKPGALARGLAEAAIACRRAGRSTLLFIATGSNRKRDGL